MEFAYQFIRVLKSALDFPSMLLQPWLTKHFLIDDKYLPQMQLHSLVGALANIKIYYACIGGDQVQTMDNH